MAIPQPKPAMVMLVSMSLDQLEPSTQLTEPAVSFGPRISFSGDFIDVDVSIISRRFEPTGDSTGDLEFEFLGMDAGESMLTADRLFYQGKLLPFSQSQCIPCTTMQKIACEQEKKEKEKEEIKAGLFLDDDPSPRPPKCSLMWKELLKFKKSHPPSSSLSSPSSSLASSSLLPSLPPPSLSSPPSKTRKVAEKNKLRNDFYSERFDVRKKGDIVKKTMKGLERSRSDGLRVMPLLNVPICSLGKNPNMDLLFAHKKY